VAENVARSTTPTTSLIERSNAQWAKPREVIEGEIASRRDIAGKESLEEWT